MQTTVRLAIAFMVLLTQSLVGAAVCGCPSAPEPANTERVVLACPVGMQPGCPCCKAHPKSATYHASGSATCAPRVIDGRQPASLATRAPIALVAIVPEPLQVPSEFATDREAPALPHLGERRIR